MATSDALVLAVRAGDFNALNAWVPVQVIGAAARENIATVLDTYLTSHPQPFRYMVQEALVRGDIAWLSALLVTYRRNRTVIPNGHDLLAQACSHSNPDRLPLVQLLLAAGARFLAIPWSWIPLDETLIRLLLDHHDVIFTEQLIEMIRVARHPICARVLLRGSGWEQAGPAYRRQTLVMLSVQYHCNIRAQQAVTVGHTVLLARKSALNMGELKGTALAAAAFGPKGLGYWALVARPKLQMALGMRTMDYRMVLGAILPRDLVKYVTAAL